MTDSELRTLIRQNPAQGHRALYDEYYNYVYAVIFRLLRGSGGSAEDAEDCLVETFTDVISHLDAVADGSLKAYIGQAARNRALTYCNALNRRQQRTVPLDTVPEPAAAHVQEELEQKALRAALLQKIRALGEPDATILIQKFYYDRKITEIAGIVRLTPAAVQMRCSRALKKLRKELADWRSDR